MIMNEMRSSSENRREFDRLYLEYRLQLIQYVVATINDRDIAEDIVQEIFYEAMRRHKAFEEHPKQIGWLYKAAGYKIKEFQRKLAQQDEVCPLPEQMEPCDFEEGYSKTEMDMMIGQALTDIELLRFRRYFLWGESTAEIARKENISENNMRVRISRLKQKINMILQQE